MSTNLFRLGSRSSRLAVLQADYVQSRIALLFPQFDFETRTYSSPGDRDRETDLRVSPSDFFTRDLDDALLAGEIDMAVHSAKDLPDAKREGIDWCWLPWKEDPRDVLVFPREVQSTGNTVRSVGVSSERREVYARSRFPDAELSNLRGNIEDRLAQLDNGNFDVLVMAGCALVRLGLSGRISEWIPESELPVPDGQGCLAITFRADDMRMLALRALFVKTVQIIGGGTGDPSSFTLGGQEALQRADVCLYDSLLDTDILKVMPPAARQIHVGKRYGHPSLKQDEINARLAEHCRRGERVVRLKGGDPGIFGRLAEEVAALDALSLPYHVMPGVTSLVTATTGTGMLLTRRGVSRGFTVMTPRMQGGEVGSVDREVRAGLPIAFFMVQHSIDHVVDDLKADGFPDDMPVAAVFSAGSAHETVLKSTLAGISSALKAGREDRRSACTAGGGEPGDPCLLLVGDTTTFGYARHGALRGLRVLVTCSDALQGRACHEVLDAGGIPLRFPSIEVVPVLPEDFSAAVCDDYDWLVVTSPSAVECLGICLSEVGADVRNLPRIAACGPGTRRALASLHLNADLVPERDFGAESLVQALRSALPAGARVLRVRSDQAGPALANALRESGAQVTDIVICSTRPVDATRLPEFDAVFFASGSSVRAFAEHRGTESLKSKILMAIGPPTARALREAGLETNVMGEQATVESCVQALARYVVSSSISP